MVAALLTEFHTSLPTRTTEYDSRTLKIARNDVGRVSNRSGDSYEDITHECLLIDATCRTALVRCIQIGNNGERVITVLSVLSGSTRTFYGGGGRLRVTVACYAVFGYRCFGEDSGFAVGVVNSIRHM